jgi:hypothetical protein
VRGSLLRIGYLNVISQTSATMGADESAEVLSIEGREVRITHPDKLYFSRALKLSKLDLVRYYLSVAPGAIATERNVEAEELDEEVPLGRPGEPEEVAALVSYLVSEQAGYVTGASFLIDGGMSQQVVYRSAG